MAKKAPAVKVSYMYGDSAQTPDPEWLKRRARAAKAIRGKKRKPKKRQDYTGGGAPIPAVRWRRGKSPGSY